MHQRRIDDLDGDSRDQNVEAGRDRRQTLEAAGIYALRDRLGPLRGIAGDGVHARAELVERDGEQAAERALTEHGDLRIMQGPRRIGDQGRQHALDHAGRAEQPRFLVVLVAVDRQRAPPCFARQRRVRAAANDVPADAHAREQRRIDADRLAEARRIEIAVLDPGDGE